MLENPFLTPPQVEGPESRSWALGFAFGFQGPEQSSLTPTDIQPEDAESFDTGVLAGQEAAIGGLAFGSPCVDLNSEGPSVPHLAPEGVEGGLALFSLIKHGFVAGLFEGVIFLVTLSIELETVSDSPDDALGELAAKLQRALQRVGIDGSMELFLGGAVDSSTFGCELKLTPIFRTRDAAIASVRALSRSKWIVASWRTDQSSGIKIVDFGDA